jgi:hypothetical protein
MVESLRAKSDVQFISKILSSNPSCSRIGIVDRMQNQFEHKRAQNEFVEIEVIKAKKYYKENALQILEAQPTNAIRNLRREA